MTTPPPPPPDPLFDALRAALPRAEPAPAEARRVHLLARALVTGDAAAPAPLRPRVGRTLLLASAVVGYFTWAVIFVVTAHLPF